MESEHRENSTESGTDDRERPFRFRREGKSRFLELGGASGKVREGSFPGTPGFRYTNDPYRIELVLDPEGEGEQVEVVYSPQFIETQGRILKALSNPDPCHLVIQGPCGAGKDLLVYSLSALLNQPFEMVHMHGLSTEYDLIHRRSFGGEGTSKAKCTGFLYSRIIQAGITGAWAVLEEPNKARVSAVVSALNPLLRDHCYRTPQGETIHFRPEFRVIFLMNPEDENGNYTVFPLSVDLMSRMFLIEVEYPSLQSEIQVLEGVSGGKVDGDLIRRLAQSAGTVRLKKESLGQEGDFSLRKLIKLCRHCALFPEDVTKVHHKDQVHYAIYEDVFFKYFIPSSDEARQALGTILRSVNVIVPRDPETLRPPVIERRGEDGAQEFLCFYSEKGRKVLELRREKGKGEIPARCVNTASTVRRKLDMCKSIIKGEHLILMGETGSGKFTVTRDLLENDLGLSPLYFHLTRNCSDQEIVAYRGFNGSATVFETGMVCRALAEGRPLVLTGLEKPAFNILAVLNNVLEEFGSLTLPDGRIIRKREGFFVVALLDCSPMQTEYYGHQLSGEFLDRFAVIRFDFLPQDEEKIYMKERFPGIDEGLIALLVKLSRTLRQDFADGRLSNPPSRLLEKVGSSLSQDPLALDELPGLLCSGLCLRGAGETELVHKRIGELELDRFFLPAPREKEFLLRSFSGEWLDALIREGQQWKDMYREGLLTRRPDKLMLAQVARFLRRDVRIVSKDSLDNYIDGITKTCFSFREASRGKKAEEKVATGLRKIFMAMKKVYIKTESAYLNKALESFLASDDEFLLKANLAAITEFVEQEQVTSLRGVLEIIKLESLLTPSKDKKILLKSLTQVIERLCGE